MRCLNTAIEATTAFVKDKNLLDANEAMGSSHLSPEAVANQFALLQAMKTVWRVCNEVFQILRDTHKL